MDKKLLLFFYGFIIVNSFLEVAVWACGDSVSVKIAPYTYPAWKAEIEAADENYDDESRTEEIDAAHQLIISLPSLVFDKTSLEGKLGVIIENINVKTWAEFERMASFIHESSVKKLHMIFTDFKTNELVSDFMMTLGSKRVKELIVEYRGRHYFPLFDRHQLGLMFENPKVRHLTLKGYSLKKNISQVVNYIIKYTGLKTLDVSNCRIDNGVDMFGFRQLTHNSSLSRERLLKGPVPIISAPRRRNNRLPSSCRHRHGHHRKSNSHDL